MIQNGPAKCPTANHEDSPIIQLCLSRTCQLATAICTHCSIEHKQHLNECYEMNTIQEMVTQYQQTLNGLSSETFRLILQQQTNKLTGQHTHLMKLEKQLGQFNFNAPFSMNTLKELGYQLKQLIKYIPIYQERLIQQQVPEVPDRERQVSLGKQAQKQPAPSRESQQTSVTFEENEAIGHCLFENNVVQCFGSIGQVFLKPDISKVQYATLRIMFEVIQCNNKGVIGIGLKRDYQDKNTVSVYSNGDIEQHNFPKSKAPNFKKWQSKDQITVELNRRQKTISYHIVLQSQDQLQTGQQVIKLPIDKFMDCSLCCYIQDAILAIRGEQWT